MQAGIIHAPTSGRAHRASRYAKVDQLIEWCRRRDTLRVGLRVDGEPHVVEWPVDFSGYHIPERAPPEPLRLFQGGEIPGAGRLHAHLRDSDLDLLAYYTCGTRQYLQNCQDRMDWFFYLDHHVDGPHTPEAERGRAVGDLLAGLEAPGHGSRLEWVNAVLSLLQEVVGQLERDGLDTSAIRHATRGYFASFLHEHDAALPLEAYLENRLHSIGVAPELEFCFAYQGLTLSAAERGQAARIQRLASFLVALQNDTCSLFKEQGEPGHLNLKTYFPQARRFVSFVTGAYRAHYASFLALRPERPGALECFWQVCHDWLRGSLVWHLTSRRYGQGQFHLLP
jgi:hypothetical protein